MGQAFCFLVGFWPWMLVVVGFSVLLGTLYASYREGVPATLEASGYGQAIESAASPERHAPTGR